MKSEFSFSGFFLTCIVLCGVLILTGLSYTPLGAIAAGDCLHTGAVSRSGQSIVCLPARVIVQLVGGSEADPGVDAVIG